MPSISALFLHRSGLEASRVYNIEVGSTIRLVALGGLNCRYYIDVWIIIL